MSVRKPTDTFYTTFDDGYSWKMFHIRAVKSDFLEFFQRSSDWPVFSYSFSRKPWKIVGKSPKLRISKEWRPIVYNLLSWNIEIWHGNDSHLGYRGKMWVHHQNCEYQKSDGRSWVFCCPEIDTVTILIIQSFYPMPI